jgi:type IV secretory pathway VirB10-like protein
VPASRPSSTGVTGLAAAVALAAALSGCGLLHHSGTTGPVGSAASGAASSAAAQAPAAEQQAKQIAASCLDTTLAQYGTGLVASGAQGVATRHQAQQTTQTCIEDKTHGDPQMTKLVTADVPPELAALAGFPGATAPVPTQAQLEQAKATAITDAGQAAQGLTEQVITGQMTTHVAATTFVQRFDKLAGNDPLVKAWFNAVVPQSLQQAVATDAGVPGL